jgi:hypothetical protein
MGSCRQHCADARDNPPQTARRMSKSVNIAHLAAIRRHSHGFRFFMSM